MNEDLLKIILHYGVNAQQRQLAEEVFELQEAITTLDCRRYDIEGDETDNIAEEIADVLVLLNQFKAYYNISDTTLLVFMKGKIDRQLERIKNEVKE